ncbi:MAG: hypothetical protein CSYNP_01265 [Syntrophus sp. SKADARSKE-3]|nr:hypothetical protein [Syntrophus sp. SKADARSKE-3]
MQPKLRTTIAYIAGRVITGLDTLSIYDHLQSKSVDFETFMSPKYIKVFSNDRGCYTAGPREENVIDLYDYGAGHLIDLQIDGNKFKGYDDYTPCNFSGEVNGNEISFYDDFEAKAFKFSFNQP